MSYNYLYVTPKNFSDIIMTSDGEMLTGLCFSGSKDGEKYEEGAIITGGQAPGELQEAISWLRTYFSGKNPGFTPAYRIENATDFRKEVLKILLTIPYGESTTYNSIAKTIGQRHGIEKMAAQAVGGAVGWNPISIIIPCHRVLGAKGGLTGYGGGIQNKIELLKLEGNSDFTL